MQLVWHDVYVRWLHEDCLCVRDATHAEFVKAWSSTLNQLQAYIKQFHTTGVEWNKQVIVQCYSMPLPTFVHCE